MNKATVPVPHDRVYLPLVEFYITNACNFNCSGCNRFNNYAFAGSSRWADFKDIYRRWGQRLTFSKATVLGGEPMICPDYQDWMLGIHEIWPESNVTLLTNGSLLRSDDRKLYDILKSNQKLHLQIGLHNRYRRDEMLRLLAEWLIGPVTVTRWPNQISSIEGAIDAWNRSYANLRGPDWPETCEFDHWHLLPEWIQQECSEVHGFSAEIFADSVQHYRLTDTNGVEVTVGWENFFHQGALILDKQTETFRLHQSDPIKSHAICHSKFCHHMERGKLYKCGQVSLFPQFYQQFHMDVDQQDIDIMHGYQPATLDMHDEEWLSWIQDLDKPMPQCRFCPESYKISEIFAAPKKIFVQKKRNKFHAKQ